MTCRARYPESKEKRNPSSRKLSDGEWITPSQRRVSQGKGILFLLGLSLSSFIYTLHPLSYSSSYPILFNFIPFYFLSLYSLSTIIDLSIGVSVGRPHPSPRLFVDCLIQQDSEVPVSSYQVAPSVKIS